MKRSDLPALTLFASVAAHRSFRGAARELGISVSALSHAINGLEASLNLRLLARTTRSVAPTEAGRKLLEGLEPALAAINEAVETASAAQNHITGTIRLTVPALAAELILAPLLCRFIQVQPGVTVEVSVQDAFTDIVAEGFDAGVRLGESLQQDMIAVPLGPAQRCLVVGAPAYFARCGIPSTPRDLHEHACIQRRFTGGNIYRWEFAKGQATMDITTNGPLIFNDERLVTQAALAGAGLAMLFEARAAEHIAAGRLVAVLEDWCPVFSGFHLYYPSRRLMRPALRAFIDFVRG